MSVFCAHGELVASQTCTSQCSKHAGAWRHGLVEQPPELRQGWDGGSLVPLERMLQEHLCHLKGY